MFKHTFYFLATLLILFSCKKEDEPTAVVPVPFANYGEGVYDIDSNYYKSVIITNAGEWMESNLKAAHFSNGDTIPSGINTVDISGMASPKFFFYPNNDSTANLNKYGRLYTYYVIEDGRNVCPSGWHVPSKEEWDILSQEVGDEEVCGGKLKSTSLWISPNFGADNESLFNAVPAGIRSPSGSATDLTKSAVFWTTTADTANRMWTYYLKYGYSFVFRSSAQKNYSNSVRCKKD